MTAFILNVTFDCLDPERIAAFWAEVTGYERMEASNEVRVALESPDGRGVRRLLFYRVPEPKTTKNRVHVDLAVKDPVSEIERLVQLGATYVERRGRSEKSWTVMLDPEGNEFCIG